MRPIRTVALALAGALLPGLAAAQVSDGVAKLGILNDMGGVYADSGGKGSVLAAQMAIDDFGGKVLDKPIVLASADHQNKPDIGLSIARQWIDQEQVDTIVDVPTSSVALAIQQFTKERNRVFLISGAGTSDLTGSACSPVGVHWTYDTYALSHVSAKAMMDRGQDSWYFITADYAFGHALECDAANEVKQRGGKVVGAVRAPFPNPDFSSFVLQAQASKAKVVALANAGGDTITAIKQAHEFGLVEGGQNLIALLSNITDTHSLGLATAQGMILTESFYWDVDDETRAWSKRFYEKEHHMPAFGQAGVYSMVLHYLKGVQAAGTDEAKAVVGKMRELPIKDFFAKNGRLRNDNRMVHDMYLMQVKTAQESQGEWDLYKVLATVSGDEAYCPVSEGGCPFVKAEGGK